MRRLAARLPALSYHFGLTPHDVEIMPMYLIDEYLMQLDDIEDALARRGR
jgi:hypothetical protein